MRNTPIRGEVVQGKTALGLCAFADFFAGIHPATPVRKLIFQPSTQTSSLSRLNRAVPLTAKTLKITRQLKLCTTPFEGFPRTGNLRDSRHSIRQSLSRSRNACSRPLRASPNTFQEPPAQGIPTPISTGIPANPPKEPNPAPVIHPLFLLPVIRASLSTHILGIITARAVPP